MNNDPSHQDTSLPLKALNSDLRDKTEAFARDILENQLDAAYTYHSIEHTLEVIKAVNVICEYEQAPEETRLLLEVAAWLHDLGYLNTYVGHEEEGKKIARKFLTAEGVKEALIRQIEALIEATKLEQAPRNHIEGIIKDADLSNLATVDALQNSEKIRHEWRIFCDRDFSDDAWDEFNYNFFRNYQYYTKYGQEVLLTGKNQNVDLLRKRIKKRKKKEEKLTRKAMMEIELKTQKEQIAKLKRRIKKIKEQQPDRGIETMFRATYRTHINLSSIADNKANILLSINAIIISVVFSSVFSQYDENQAIIYPSFAILMVSMGTIVFAILATRPKVNSINFTREDIKQKKTNLLFFGNFHSMSLGDYMWGIQEMMRDADYLYGTMSKDIYFLGVVLAKKFRLLRLAYNIFMYGMGAAIIVFALTLWLAG
ncbi:MAG: Pycsar system effector family protein [Bacteroidota bacterium]